MSNAGPAFYSLPKQQPKQEEVKIEEIKKEPEVVEPENIQNLEVVNVSEKNNNKNENLNIMAEEQNTTTETITPIETPSDPTKETSIYSSKYFNTKTERNIFFWFIIAPIIISFVSAFHLVDFFNVGNNLLISWILSLSFELGNISSLIGIVALRSLRKGTRFFLWIVIIFLYGLQLIGNVFASFSFITSTSALKMYEFFGLNAHSVSDSRIVAIIIGSVLTICSFSLVKISSDYLRKTDEKK